MSLFAEAPSWRSPPALDLSPEPRHGSKAPSTAQLPIPAKNCKPTVIAFLRHCGCPFAEASFLNLRATAAQHPDINFVAISHSDRVSTDKWLEAVGGQGKASNPVQIIVDADRQIYAKWGLGTCSWMHVLSPGGLMAVYRLGKEKGIWNRPTESGNRWQTGGNWAVDKDGIVRWGGVSQRADEVPEYEEALEAILGVGKESAKL